MRALQANVNALKLGGKASKETIFLVVAWAVSGMLLVNQALYLTAMPGATILTQKIMRTFSKPLAKTVQPKPARHQRMRYVPELHLIYWLALGRASNRVAPAQSMSDMFKQEFSTAYLNPDKHK